MNKLLEARIEVVLEVLDKLLPAGAEAVRELVSKLKELEKVE